MTLLEKLEDLHKQATTDRSHFYTASVLKETIAFIQAVEKNKTTNSQKYEVETAVSAILSECRAIKRSLNK